MVLENSRMKKIIDKFYKRNFFGNRFYFKIEDMTKNFVEDVHVEFDIWKKYNIGEMYSKR